MAVFQRPDSPYYWLWLETAPHGQQREKTAVLIGSTVSQRTDSKRKADAVYIQRMSELAARIHRLPTAKAAIRFDAYAAIYLRDVISHHKGSDREAELLKVLVAGFGHDILSTIDRERVQAWMQKRRQAVSARTVNREIDLLKAMCRDAVPKYLTANPIAGMKRLRIVLPKRRLLTYAEEKRLLDAAEDPQDAAIIILGLDSLLRLGDLLDLKRSDRKGNWIYVRDPKGGDPFEIPLSPRAVTALGQIRAGRSEYYFPKFRCAQKPRDWRGSVRQRLEYLCQLADVPYGRTQGGITFHWATRRTGATRLLMKRRQPVPVVQRLGNWKKPDVLLGIYAEADRSDLAKAVGLLPAHSRSKRKTG